MKYALCLLALLSLGMGYDAEKISDAIYLTEGGKQARQAYGIEGFTCKSKKECRKICVNTINNKRRAWMKEGSSDDFIDYLAKKYCPVNHKVWAKNTKFFLRKKS